MKYSIDKINKIQDEWFRIVNEYISSDVKSLLLSKHPIENFEQIIKLFTESTIMIPFGDERITNFEFSLNLLLKEIKLFWDKNGEDFFKSINEIDHYSLVLPPYTMHLYSANIVKRLGIYFDTLFIPDPLHLNLNEYNSILFDNYDRITRKVRFVQGLSHILKLQELRSKNVDIPIFIITPDISEGNRDRDNQNVGDFFLEELLHKSVKKDDFSEVIWDIKHDKMSLSEKYFKMQYINKLKNSLGFDERGLIYELYTNSHQSPISIKNTDTGDVSTLKWLIYQLIDSFDIYSRSFQNAISFSIDPIFPNQLWDVYIWLSKKISPNDSIFSPKNYEEIITASGLLDKKLRFLEALSLNDLRIIREDGNLNSIRKTLRLDRIKLRNANPNNLAELSNEFSSNIVKEIIEYGERIQKDEKFKRSNRIKSVGSFASTIGMATIPYIISFAGISEILLSLTSVIFSGNTVSDIVAMQKNEKQQKEYQTCIPLGIMYGTFAK